MISTDSGRTWLFSLFLLFALGVASSADEPKTTPPPETPKAEGVAARATALLEEAKSAKAAQDVPAATAKVTAAIELLFEKADGASSSDRRKLLGEAGWLAFEVGAFPIADRALTETLTLCSSEYADDHPDLQKVRLRLGTVKYRMRDLKAARDLCQKAFDIFSRTLPEDHEDLQGARMTMAAIRYEFGDREGAKALYEKMIEIFSRTLAEDDSKVLTAREGLASVLKSMGDLKSAIEIQEDILRVRTRTLTEDDFLIQRIRINLGATKVAARDFKGAHKLFEQALASFSRTFPDNHPYVMQVRFNLAGVAQQLGDLESAAKTQEGVLEVYSRTLPRDHVDLQKARHNLAVTLQTLGELNRARRLKEQNLAVRSRTLPKDHPNVLLSQSSLAGVLFELGDLARAKSLQEEVLRVRSRTLPADHPSLQLTRGAYARTLRAMGNTSGARELQEQLLAAHSATPEDHPDLQFARANLAETMQWQGDFQGARTLQEQVLQSRSRTLPVHHPFLNETRMSLSRTLRGLGDLAGARAIEQKVVDETDWDWAKGRLALTLADLAADPKRNDSAPTDWSIQYASLASGFCDSILIDCREFLLTASSREAEERCAGLFDHLSRVLSLAEGLGVFPPVKNLNERAFVLSETTRGGALMSAKLARLAQLDARSLELFRDLRAARADVARLAQSSNSPEGLNSAQSQRDSTERQLLEHVQKLGLGSAVAEFDPKTLEGQLSDSDAVVAYRGYMRFNDRKAYPKSRWTHQMCAFVVAKGRESCVSNSARSSRSAKPWLNGEHSSA